MKELQRLNGARAVAERMATERRAELQKLADRILSEGTECLASEKLTIEERDFVTHNRDNLNQSLQDHDRVLEAISSPAVRSAISFVLIRTILAATMLARFAPPVDAIARHEKDHRAAHMRRKREERPERIALYDTIAKAVGQERVLRPTKLADSILEEVNSQMVGAGHKAVKVDVIRRVLEKFRALEERVQDA